MLRRFAAYHGTVAVGNHDAAIIRQDVGWEALGDGKIKPVSIWHVIGPFSVTAKIGDGAFDLDDDKFTATSEPYYISAPSVGQAKFGERAKANFGKHAADAPGQATG